MERKTFVYFIQQGFTGPIKIGCSHNPMARLCQLQTAHADTLRLLHAELGDFHNERDLHARFARARLAGEWFRPTIRLIWHIRDLILVDAHENGDPDPSAVVEQRLHQFAGSP